MRRADLRLRRGLVRLNRADLNPQMRRAGLRLGHDEGRGLVRFLDPAHHDGKIQSNFEDGKNTRNTFLEQT